MDYLWNNRDLLNKDGDLCVGGWFNSSETNQDGDDKVYFDLSVRFEDPKKAYRFARQNGQLGMFDLKNGKTIQTLTPEQRSRWEKRRGERQNETGWGTKSAAELCKAWLNYNTAGRRKRSHRVDRAGEWKAGIGRTTTTTLAAGHSDVRAAVQWESEFFG